LKNGKEKSHFFIGSKKIIFTLVVIEDIELEYGEEKEKHCSRISINKVSKVHLYLINICEIFHLLTVNGSNKNNFWVQVMLMGCFCLQYFRESVEG
jgi:hypothetical protein